MKGEWMTTCGRGESVTYSNWFPIITNQLVHIIWALWMMLFWHDIWPVEQACSAKRGCSFKWVHLLVLRYVAGLMWWLFLIENLDISGTYLGRVVGLSWRLDPLGNTLRANLQMIISATPWPEIFLLSTVMCSSLLLWHCLQWWSIPGP